MEFALLKGFSLWYLISTLALILETSLWSLSSLCNFAVAFLTNRSMPVSKDQVISGWEILLLLVWHSFHSYIDFSTQRPWSSCGHFLSKNFYLFFVEPPLSPLLSFLQWLSFLSGCASPGCFSSWCVLLREHINRLVLNNQEVPKS